MFKYVVSAVIKNEIGEILAVKRRKDEKEHPDMWGLPALSFKPPEMPESALKRLAKEKLNCEIEPICFLGAIAQNRPSYRIFLLLYEARVEKGKPDVYSNLKYSEQAWVKDLSIFFPIAKKGSACAQLLLYSQGLLKEEDLILDLAKEMLEG